MVKKTTQDIQVVLNGVITYAEKYDYDFFGVTYCDKTRGCRLAQAGKQEGVVESMYTFFADGPTDDDRIEKGWLEICQAVAKTIGDNKMRRDQFMNILKGNVYNKTIVTDIKKQLEDGEDDGSATFIALTPKNDEE